MAAPTITSISPTDGYNQWPVTQTIEIFFDQEIDAYSGAKALFLHGPDTDVFVGPGMENLLSNGWNSTEAALKSPGYQGDVDVNIKFIKVDSDGDVIDDQFTYTEAGLEFTKVEISPVNALYPLTDYKLFIAGDTVENTLSINSRSVFDAQADIDNTGTGEIVSSGVYNGAAADTLVVEFTRSGDQNTAGFDYYFASDPSGATNVHSYAGIQELADGLFIEAFGEFKSGDIFTIALKPAEQITATIVVNFTTAANHVEVLPTEVSDSPIGITGPGEVATTEFALVSCTPGDGSSNVSLNTNRLVFTFNNDIDPTSVTHETVQVLFESVDGGDQNPVPYSFIVNGNKLYVNLMEH